MEMKFDPKAKVKQGDLGSDIASKKPTRDSINVDFSVDAPRKGESELSLKKMDYPSKSGSEHVQDSFFKLANEKDY